MRLADGRRGAQPDLEALGVPRRELQRGAQRVRGHASGGAGGNGQLRLAQRGLFKMSGAYTNNTAELTAVARALEHVCADQSGRPVLIRYDSLYAGRMYVIRRRGSKPEIDRVRPY